MVVVVSQSVSHSVVEDIKKHQHHQCLGITIMKQFLNLSLRISVRLLMERRKLLYAALVLMGGSSALGFLESLINIDQSILQSIVSPGALVLE
jgi:hypothetical protein